MDASFEKAMFIKRTAFLAALLLSACATVPAPDAPGARSEASLPARSRLSGGYLTISEAPPSPLPVEPLPEPQFN